MLLFQLFGGCSHQLAGVGLAHTGTRAGDLGLYQQGTSRQLMPMTPKSLLASCECSKRIVRGSGNVACG